LGTFVLPPLILKIKQMPLVPNFTASQVPGNPSNVTFTDVSTGSDVAITQRRVYVQDAFGVFLVEEGTTTEYEQWAIGDTSIALDLFSKDYAVQVVVQWLNVSDVVLYSKTLVFSFTQYNENFDYQLTTLMASNPKLIEDNSFYSNKSKLRVFLDGGDLAVSNVGDIYAAQLCYDQATLLRLSSQYYFNANS
jgi:hypothetical protein